MTLLAALGKGLRAVPAVLFYGAALVVQRRRGVREVVLCGSLASVVLFASLGWAWPTIVALGVLAVSLFIAAEARS